MDILKNAVHNAHAHLVIASGNLGKLAEIQQLLHGLAIETRPQSAWSLETPEETGQTFVENALIKARFAAMATGWPALADDSGLVVDALQGAPGVYTARYGGLHLSAEARYLKLLTALQNVPWQERTAHYHCTMVYLRYPEDPDPAIFQGRWSGQIALTPKGHGGFGYDPIFFVPTHDCTAAELPDDEKNRISHRGQAFAEFSKFAVRLV